jgi:hypothetical protein
MYGQGKQRWRIFGLNFVKIFLENVVVVIVVIGWLSMKGGSTRDVFKR